MAEETADLNPYQFGNDNPISFNDPMGDHVFAWDRNVWNNADGTDPFGGSGGGGGSSGIGGGPYGALWQNILNGIEQEGLYGKPITSNIYGQWGYWQHFDIAGDGGYSGGVVVGTRFVALNETLLKELIKGGDYVGAYRYIFNSFPEINNGLKENRDYYLDPTAIGGNDGFNTFPRQPTRTFYNKLFGYSDSGLKGAL